MTSTIIRKDYRTTSNYYIAWYDYPNKGIIEIFTSTTSPKTYTVRLLDGSIWKTDSLRTIYNMRRQFSEIDSRFLEEVNQF